MGAYSKYKALFEFLCSQNQKHILIFFCYLRRNAAFISIISELLQIITIQIVFTIAMIKKSGYSGQNDVNTQKTQEAEAM